MRKTLLLVALLGAPLALGGCGDDEDDDTGGGPVAPGVETATALIGLDPLGDSDNIATTERVTLLFDGAMDTTGAASPFVDLHSPDLAGATVPLTCGWGIANSELVCAPTAPLAPNTTYVVHVAGAGFRNSEGDLVSIPRGLPLGGTAVTAATSATHAGQPFTSLGEGWADATGGYGTSFTFETGGS